MTTVAHPYVNAPPVEVAAAEQAVIDAARDLAARMKITPRWWERLTPQARQLVAAVDTLNQAQAAVPA